MFTMRPLINRRRLSFITIALLTALSVAWVYWNRPQKDDLSQYAPVESLAFIEANDLAEVVSGIDQTNAWQMLAAPIGAPAKLSPNHWWVRLARWTGIASIDAILLARSQVAVVFSGAEGSQSDSVLTIKPLTTFIVETHTSQRRMRAPIELHIEELARRIYKDPVFVRKTIENQEFSEWTSADGTHKIVFTFLNTAVIVGNDEPSVLLSLRARTGNRSSLRDVTEFKDVRARTQASGAAVFGFVSQAGLKSLLQAYALFRNGSSSDSITNARIFSDTFGGAVKNAGWAATFRDGIVEDRCSIGLADGVANKIRPSLVPDHGPNLTSLDFVPAEVHSLSLYQLHDISSFWSDLNAVISAHADLMGAIAARPLLASILKTYGIDDPGAFTRAIGTRVQTIRYDENSPSVMVAEAFDLQTLRNIALRRLGPNPKSERIGGGELLVSATDNWAVAFINNYFLIGSSDLVRHSLLVQSQDSPFSKTESFSKAQSFIDVSLPISALTFTRDDRAAISFIETFAHQQRSAFATTGAEVDRAKKRLPLAVSATVLKESSLEWTARSSFGLGGLLATQLFPTGHQ